MKYIEYVKVDAKDGRPETEYPTRHGPADPLPGIEQLWYEHGAVVHYFGSVADDADTDAPGVLTVLDTAAVTAIVEHAKPGLLAQATDLRWRIETGGMTLPGGVRVATGTEDQNRITSVIANAELAGVETVDFKAASGWVTLSLAEIKAIAGAIALHVQACFSAERSHHEAIALIENLHELHEYDVDHGWPTTAAPT